MHQSCLRPHQKFLEMAWNHAPKIPTHQSCNLDARGSNSGIWQSNFGANRSTLVPSSAILVQKLVASRSCTRLDNFFTPMSLFFLASLPQRAIHLGRKKRGTKPVNPSLSAPCMPWRATLDPHNATLMCYRATLVSYDAIFCTLTKQLWCVIEQLRCLMIQFFWYPGEHLRTQTKQL
jgi:hypothetical protein